MYLSRITLQPHPLRSDLFPFPPDFVPSSLSLPCPCSTGYALRDFSLASFLSLSYHQVFLLSFFFVLVFWPVPVIRTINHPSHDNKLIIGWLSQWAQLFPAPAEDRSRFTRAYIGMDSWFCMKPLNVLCMLDEINGSRYFNSTQPWEYLGVYCGYKVLLRYLDQTVSACTQSPPTAYQACLSGLQPLQPCSRPPRPPLIPSPVILYQHSTYVPFVPPSLVLPVPSLLPSSLARDRERERKREETEIWEALITEQSLHRTPWSSRPVVPIHHHRSRSTNNIKFRPVLYCQSYVINTINTRGSATEKLINLNHNPNHTSSISVSINTGSGTNTITKFPPSFLIS